MSDPFPKLVWSVILDFLPQKYWHRVKVNKRIRNLINHKIQLEMYSYKELSVRRMQKILINRGSIETFRYSVQKRGFFYYKCYGLLEKAGFIRAEKKLRECQDSENLI